MKKNLLFTGAMALFMASCSQTEFEQIEAPQPVDAKGVTFAASINEDAETRAAYNEVEGQFIQKWYADLDKIGVFYKVDTKVDVFKGKTAEAFDGNGWNGLQVESTKSNSFEFKATASGNKGYFVANGDANTLWLQKPSDPSKGYSEQENPVFRAYWPLEESRVDFAATDGTKIGISAYAAATQTQKTTDGHGIVEKVFMVSESTPKYTYDENDNSVVKDRFELNFKRTNPIVSFKIKTNSADDAAINREYKRDYAENLFTRFGNLKTIELEAKGSADPVIAASKLTYNSDATWNVAAENIYDKTEAFTAGTKDDAASKITLTLKDGSGLAWSNDAVAFMSIADVKRSTYPDGAEEEVIATYTFANIKLQTSIKTANNWVYKKENINKDRNWIAFPSPEGYDIDSEPYIAYNSDNGYVLEVNPSFTGNLADLFEANNLKGIKKADDTNITKSEIKHFVSKVNITDAADFTTIKSLTNLTNVTLLENTTLPSKAFAGLSNLVYVNLPKVTTVAKIDAFPENNYTEVYMGSYDFSDEPGTNQTAVRDLLLKKDNLKNADISAVTNINAGFPNSGVTFTGFTNLEEISVKSGVVIGGTSFKGCTKLKLVQFPKGVVGGSVNLLEGANSQFMNCTALTAISISNTTIPDQAFSGCAKLATINSGSGQAITPTAIGISSFEGCAVLVDMNLSNATTIGAKAFKGCTKLVGNNVKNEARTVLYVDAITHVADNTFENCSALKFISFAKATTIGVDILKGATCQEIEFLKPFTVNSEVATTTKGTPTNFFGTTTNTKLFCAKAQTGVSVNDIKLTGNAADSEAVTETFGHGITRDAE